MNPEEIISAFLSVWEKQPELFRSPELSDSLGDLQKDLIALETTPDREIADCLERWLENYEDITNAVVAANTRKLRGDDNVSQNTDDTALVNQYPKITDILRTRAPKMGKKEGQS